MDAEDTVTYWQSTGNEKWKTAEALMEKGRYADALFFCHLALESLLKAVVAQETKMHPPYVHDLPDLALRANLELSEEQTKNFSEITTFNIRARYDDYKLSFYKKATEEYADRYFKIAKELYLWTQNKLNKEK